MQIYRLFVVILLVFFQLAQPILMTMFYYFAYGSNLLAQRIHINNPTAVRVGIGKLNGYRLDFNIFDPGWEGCPSTVVPDTENHVWGAIWQLNISDMANLDHQEEVQDNVYVPFQPSIVTLDGKNVSCRCYKLVNQPSKQILLAPERRPSKAYLRTIILGANESNLPSEYLKFPNEIPDNGNNGPSMPWL